MSAANARPLAQYGLHRSFGARIGVSLLGVAANAIGLLPAMSFFNQPLVSLVALAMLIISAIATGLSIQATNLHRPKWFEFIAAGLSAISQGSLVSIVALAFYGLVVGAHWLVNWGFRLLGSSLVSDWTDIATAAGLGIGLFALVGESVITVNGLWQMLYPPVAGYSTPFRDDARSPRGRLGLLAGVVAALSFVAFALWYPLSRFGLTGCFIAGYGLLGATINYWTPAKKQTAARVFTTSDEALAAILEALDFKVIAQPRTGFPEIDPYLADLDFVLFHDARTFAVLVQEGETQRSELECVSQVLVGAHALAEGLKRREVDTSELKIEPVLIFVGQRETPALASFPPSRQVLIIRIPDAAELQPSTKDTDVLRSIGKQLLEALLRERLEPAVERAESLSS